MDKVVVFLPSITLGAIFIGLYLFRCYRAQKSPDLSVLVSSLLQASCFICGFFLMASTISEKVKQVLTGIKIYIFIAGIAVIYVSAQWFYRDIIKSTKSKENDL